ncbi:SapB/AmfS family lanthipeptide [Actinocrispum wychmicini]|uniref:Uncharacterized protein n=1 Tax=Actinocrispum wychmicini TaxID=1213861 RepID=A0A4R2JM65_9PSEU|nr:SapB/AmfS family lanthipeptide [Actinocrispum wychmicini]TCO59702.1 hypothetical protein EV192_104545 [Actinocrispum wychmicini]
MANVLDLQTLEAPANNDEALGESWFSNHCCSCLSVTLCN